MSVFFWYKNAALIEKEHPMIAGFFRLKDRTARRPGFAVDPLFVHLRKRARETFRLFVSWAKFVKEMEEVWLQTRKKSEREERWLEEIQRIQGEIWQSLKVAEWQKSYNDAKTALPARAKALLDPFEELCSKVLVSREDLNSFLRKWASLQKRLQKLRSNVIYDGEAARQLDEMSRIHKNAWAGRKIQEWQGAYARLRDVLPSKFSLPHVKFDVFSNRAVYSRQHLQEFWAANVDHLKVMRFWKIRPLKLVKNLAKDFFITTSFASSFKAASRSQY
jgi:hypothetical protein